MNRANKKNKCIHVVDGSVIQRLQLTGHKSP